MYVTRLSVWLWFHYWLEGWSWMQVVQSRCKVQRVIRGNLSITMPRDGAMEEDISPIFPLRFKSRRKLDASEWALTVASHVTVHRKASSGRRPVLFTAGALTFSHSCSWSVSRRSWTHWIICSALHISRSSQRRRGIHEAEQTFQIWEHIQILSAWAERKSEKAG